ncbi:MAG TPA: DUF1800 domain-containing protein, partial [Acidimicrobiia bacterium]|nr:DUF1800 domain-containing protein [Acidimicrobiia bacterium]
KAVSVASAVPTAPALLGSPPVATPPEEERRRVARLFARAGFGASVDEIDQAATKGYAAAVEELLVFPPAAGRPDEATVLALEAGAPAGESEAFSMGTFQRWWLDRMSATRFPLEEKLTLYWHNHFATGFSKVKRPKAMVAQNRLLRDHAGGNFRALCNAITADAAMLIWLDGNMNQKILPNENYGREFMELFTLGRDRYTQEDVRQATRAFTGYTTDGQGRALYHPELHDDGDKTVLGQTGKWGATDMTDIVLDRHPEGPVAARYVSARLAGFLYKPGPEPEVVDAMASAFVTSNYDIKAMVKALLLRPEFSDGPGLTIKSPAEYIASTMRLLRLTGAPTPSSQPRRRSLDEIASACADMGQELFEPPDVSGWKGGATWANTAATLARYNFAARIGKLVTDNAVRTVLDSAGGQPRDTAPLWMHRLGILSLLPSTQASIERYLEASHAAKTDPGVRTRGVLTLLLASPDFNLR